MREHRFNAFFIKLKEQLPEELGELTGEEFAKVTEIIFSKFSEEGKKQRFIHALSLPRFKYFGRWVKLSQISHSQSVELGELMGWLLDPELSTEICLISDIEHLSFSPVP